MTDVPFLPEDYSEPSNSEYTKLDSGTTQIRFLWNPIQWWNLWEDYTKDDWSEWRRVTRWRKEQDKPIPTWSKTVWTCLVWNYNDSRMQVWDITQKSIRDQIVWLYRKKARWDLKEYDIEVTKEWEKMQTSYTVTPCPKSSLPDIVKNALMSTPVNFDVYFDGDSPFWAEKTAEPEDVF